MSKNPDDQSRLDMETLDAKRVEAIRQWVAENLDGSVDEIERLKRWRPLWRVAYSTGRGERRTVLVRGDRPIASLFSLEHEMKVMKVLEANGIRVPHIHSWSTFPKAFVLDWIETDRDRDPGMIHTAIENPTGMTDERWEALLTYLEGLAEMHRIPVTAFKGIECYAEPATARDVALNMIEQQYRFGLDNGLIDPILATVMSWLRAHVPPHRDKAVFLTGDAGQFMSRGTEVAAFVDFEIAHIGDMHWDLACFRGRHPYEHMGDIPALYRRYAEVSGTPVELPVIGYHTASFLLFSAIAARAFMEPDARDANWIEGLFEYASCARRAIEAIAELEGIALDSDLHLPPEPFVDAFAESGLRKLVNDVERLPLSSAFAGWERELLKAVPHFLLNQVRYGGWFAAETIGDIAALTHGSHRTLAEADTAIGKLIDERGGQLDAELIRIMHRRALRLSMLTAGSDPTDKNPLFFRLEPILER